MLDVGIHYDISPDYYHTDPCVEPTLSSSIAKVVVEQSAANAHLKHPRLGKPPESKEERQKRNMSRGTVMHALMLGVSRRIVLINEKDFRKDCAKDARDHALRNGAVPVLADDLLEWDAACDPIRARLREEWGLELNGRSEVVVVWREMADDGTSVLCRCQLDHLLLESPATIIDLKFSESAHPDFCARQWISMGYDIQRAAYTRAIEATFPDLAGRVEFKLAFCEPTAPHAVTVSQAAGSMREHGERRWRRAVNTWARCLKTNEWPTYTRTVVMAEAKPWDIEKEIMNNDAA